MTGRCAAMGAEAHGVHACASPQEPDHRPLRPPVGPGFWGYLLYCTLAVGGTSCLAIALWSGMGSGERCLRALQDGAGYRPLALGACTLLLAVLYLLDYFWPPHLPGQRLALWDGDRSTAPWLLGVFAALAATAGLLSAKENPSWPMLANVVACALSVALLRAASRPPRSELEQLAEKIARHGDGRAKAELLQAIVWREEDQRWFFRAASVAFLLSSVATFSVWLLWALGEGSPEQGPEPVVSLGSEDEDLERLLWATPLAMAASELVFGLFALLRLVAQPRYAATNSLKAQLLAEQAAEVEGFKSDEVLEAARQRGIEQCEHHVRHLEATVKFVGIMFLALLVILYIAGQLLYTGHIASMIAELLGVFFFSFLLFVYAAFGRVVTALGRWVVEQPWWRAARAAQRSSWARALLVCAGLPLAPAVFALSVLNQSVRLRRGLYSGSVAGEDGPLPTGIECPREDANPEKHWFTPRVHAALAALRQWEWLAVLARCYALCGLYLCYTVCPLLLNVCLSWLGVVLQGWPFEVLIVATFTIGVLAFLLPPVPGMTIYIFGGLVISGAAEAGGYWGFWGGALINIVMCWFLKLFACAIQQKCIGEMLGKSLWVRKTVGVHRAHIRCIEAILREPGLSVGKAAILCGGPDWPTSVLAGVLKLSLVQCELGTMPIIFFVTPCALTGSFYLKKGVNEVWTRSANLMIALSVAVNLLLWALAALAIRRQLEQHHEALTRPLPENVDLEWLDHRAEGLEQASNVSWRTAPFAVRWVLASCACVQILICQGFFWAYSSLFGNFEVQDSIDDLDLYHTGDEDRKYVFAAPAVAAVLALFGAAWLGLVWLWHWRWRTTREARRKAALALDAEELAWKERFVQEALAGPGAQELTADQPAAGSVKDEAADEAIPSSEEVTDETARAGVMVAQMARKLARHGSQAGNVDGPISVTAFTEPARAHSLPTELIMTSLTCVRKVDKMPSEELSQHIRAYRTSREDSMPPPADEPPLGELRVLRLLRPG